MTDEKAAVMYAPDKIIPMRYADARPLIVDGDIALYRCGDSGKWSNMLISHIGGSPYVHAGMVYRSLRCHEERLMLAETIQWVGGRIIPFSKQVEGYPDGQWDIYRPKQPYNAIGAVLAIEEGVNERYGWRALIRASLGHTRYISKFLKPFPDAPIGSGTPLFCSALVAAACRDGGRRDPQPNIGDANTEPGHLADPGFAEYKFTLHWDQIPRAA